MELNKNERIWVRNWISERDQKEWSTMLLQQLKAEDPTKYGLAMRMTAEILLLLVSNNIFRNNTLFTKIKLEVTFSFLVTGDYKSLSHMYPLAKSSILKIILSFCQKIKRALTDQIKVINLNFNTYMTMFIIYC